MAVTFICEKPPSFKSLDQNKMWDLKQLLEQTYGKVVQEKELYDRKNNLFITCP